jgi:hypothetical protein
MAYEEKREDLTGLSIGEVCVGERHSGRLVKC